MRRVLFSTIALFALLFNSCELLPSDNVDNNNTNVEREDEFHVLCDSILEVSADGGNAEIEYVIDTVVEGAVLTATSTAEWISNIKVGDTVTFNFEKNTNIEERFDYISLEYGNTSVLIGISQLGREVSDEAQLEVTCERTINFAGNGGTGTIPYTITGGEEGDKPIVESNKEWINSIVVSENEISFVVDENTSTSARRGSIRITYGTYDISVIITQDANSNIPVLTANRKTIQLGEAITFTVTLANKDVTASAQIFDYYTKSEVSNPYTPTEIAQHVFYAKYNDNSSSLLTINVVASGTPTLPEDNNPESFDFNQRILLVDHTGAGCSYCPSAKSAFKSAEENSYYNYKFNVVYSYSFSSNELCYSSAARTLWTYFQQVCSTGDKLSGYPSFTTNYCFNYTGKYNVIDRINEFWDKDVTASVALATKRDGNKLVVNAAVKSSKSQHFKISLWLLEDDIYATQSGATATWMHTHHNVMRDAITGISSADIAGVDFGYVTEYTTYERVMNFDLFIGSSWNINNCKLIAIISAPNSKYNNKYEVVNTAICEIGGSVGFDYKK